MPTPTAAAIIAQLDRHLAAHNDELAALNLRISMMSSGAPRRASIEAAIGRTHSAYCALELVKMDIEDAPNETPYKHIAL